MADSRETGTVGRMPAVKRALFVAVAVVLAIAAVVAYQASDWAKVPASANATAAFSTCADQQAESTIYYHPRLDAGGNFVGFHFYADGLSCDTTG